MIVVWWLAAPVTPVYHKILTTSTILHSPQSDAYCLSFWPVDMWQEALLTVPSKNVHIIYIQFLVGKRNNWQYFIPFVPLAMQIIFYDRIQVSDKTFNKNSLNGEFVSNALVDRSSHVNYLHRIVLCTNSMGSFQCVHSDFRHYSQRSRFVCAFVYLSS